MKNRECIDYIFSILPDIKNISIYQSTQDVLTHVNYIAINFNEDSESVSGRVKSDYKSKDTKYSCEMVYEKLMFSIEQAEKLLECAKQIIMHTGSAVECSMEIIKRESDYRLIIPEVERKHYWASRYFEEYEDEIEKEEILTIEE